MGERPALSKGEMEVARVLWELGPTTVRTIYEAIAKDREIDFATVQTFLRRIEAKGYATSELQGRARVYAAKARPKTVIRKTVEELLDRLFGGEPMPLVRHLIEESRMDGQELEELRQLIDELDKATDSQSESRKARQTKHGGNQHEQ